MSRRLRPILGCTIAVLAVAFTGGEASAHAVVDEISPADGSALRDAPGEVVVVFSEPILEHPIEIEIRSSGRDPVADAVAHVDIADLRRLVVTLPPLGTATFEVQITARDRTDLHEVTARTSFSIGEPAPAPAPPVLAAASPLEAGFRWLFVLGLALVVGTLAYRSRWPEVPIGRPRAVGPMVGIGLSAIVVGRVGVDAARGLDLDTSVGETLRALGSTGDVRRLPFVALSVACVAPIVSRRAPLWLDLPIREANSTTVRTALAWIGVGWLTLLAAWGDHSALGGSTEIGTALMKAAHLWGVALWVGLLLAGALLNARCGTLNGAFAAVSTTAIAAALLTIGSGLLLTGRLVESMTALLSTTYGLFLIAKVGALVLAVIAGVVSHRRRRGGAFEMVGLVAVAALGALLATTGPAIGPAFERTDERQATEASADVLADDLLLHIQAIPGTPGENTLRVRVSETRRPAPAVLEQARLSVPGGAAVAVPLTEGVAFFERVMLDSGTNTLSVSIDRTDWPSASAAVPVVAQTPMYTYPSVISSTPLAPTASWIGLTAIGLGALVAADSRRRRRSASRFRAVEASQREGRACAPTG